MLLFRLIMLYPNLETDLIRLKKINNSLLTNKELRNLLGHNPSTKLKDWGFLKPYLNSKLCGKIWIVEIPEHLDLIEFVYERRRELSEIKANNARKSESHKIWGNQSYYFICSR
jgi:hypothetical protein